MNEVKIAELRETEKALRAQVVALDKEAVEEVKKYLEPLCPLPIAIYDRCGYYDWGFDVEVLKDDGERYFGADISVRLEDNYGRAEPSIELNTGTCGHFGKDNLGQVAKYQLMGELVKRFDELLEMGLAHQARTKDLKERMRKADWEAEKLEAEDREAERKEKLAKAMEQIKPGAWFQFQDSSAYLIVKVTPKMVFYKFYSNDTRYFYNEETKDYDKSKVWTNTDGWRNETDTHQGFINRLTRDGYVLTDKPDGVKLPQ